MLSRNLIIALEPEAASLWCKQLPQEGFMADSSDKKKFEDSPGIQYIVVDCGGKIFPVQQVPSLLSMVHGCFPIVKVPELGLHCCACHGFLNGISHLKRSCEQGEK